MQIFALIYILQCNLLVGGITEHTITIEDFFFFLQYANMLPWLTWWTVSERRSRGENMEEGKHFGGETNPERQKELQRSLNLFCATDWFNVYNNFLNILYNIFMDLCYAELCLPARAARDDIDQIGPVAINGYCK